MKAEWLTCTWQLLLEPFESRVLNYDVVRKILYERKLKFLSKIRNI